MMKFLNIKDKEFFRELFSFLIIGVSNTLISAVGMFLLYNLAGFGYWGSSSFMYFTTSIYSFFMNRKFTFQNEGNVWAAAIRFFVNIGICYFIAYTLAPYVLDIIIGLVAVKVSAELRDQIAMLIGMVLFTGLNYLGQKLFVFRKKEEE